MNDTSDNGRSTVGVDEETFAPGFWNALTGHVLALALLAAGAALVGQQAWDVYASGGKPLAGADGRPDWGVVVVMTVIGLGLVAGGVALLRYARWLRSHRVEVHADGFRYCAGASADEVRWSDVIVIREEVLYQRPPLLKGPAKLLLPKVATTSYTVTTRGGKEYDFDENSVKGVKRFGAVIREHAMRCGVPWETVEQHA